MIKAAVKTTSTFSKRSSNFRKLAEDIQKGVLRGSVEVAIKASPVKTAAYVDSFGFNGPQGFSSKNRQLSQDAGAAKARNLQRLLRDIDSLSVDGPIVFTNNAPHADAVEIKHGHRVFAQVRQSFRDVARAAAQKAKQQ